MTAYLLDTNILLRLVDSTAPAHNLVLDAVAAIWGSGNDCVLTGQVLIEFWVVATRPIQVNGLGWTAQRADDEISQLLEQFPLLEDDSTVFVNWRRLVIRTGVLGKRSHDVRLVAVMLTHQVTHLLTLNPDDFSGLSEIEVVHPQAIA
jgi:predicted nucleic acid-binding protein